MALAGPLALILAACGGTPGSSTGPTAGTSAGPSAAPSGSALSEEVVTIGTAFAQMRGHHIAARELFAAGETDGALTHATRPVAEILDSVRGDVDENSGDSAALAAALQAVVTAAQGDSDAALTTAIDASSLAIDAAEQAVAGDFIDDPAYIGSVIAATLDTASGEYAEALNDTGIGELIEYQEAYAFTRQAASDYEGIAADVAAANAEEAAEIEEAFEALSAALPGAQPPATVAALAEVEAAVGLIARELEEVVGALPVNESDPAAAQAAIEELLDQIGQLVAAGDRVQAAELAAKAYLDHYEVIEPAVIAAAPEINDELEPLLGPGLRQQISSGATVDEIDQSIARARDLLGQAIEALEQR